MQLTHFAPPEKDTGEEIARQVRLIDETPILHRMFDAVPTIVMLLNRRRQALYINRSLLALLGIQNPGEVLGKRPGEILRCVNADQPPAGCGTTEFCRTCGAAQAIMQSYRGEQATYECRISRRTDNDQMEALDLRVSATPFEMEKEQITIFAIVDISGEKRRDILERIFFHDISNTASSILGFAQMMEQRMPQALSTGLDRILKSANRLAAEIAAQKQLFDAERGALTLTFLPISALNILNDACQAYIQHPLAENIHILLAPESEDARILTDPALLSRVLGNMVKNAVEASAPGDTVTLRCRCIDGSVEFSVHNPVVMPRDVELQVFQRSFSTKGAGRGLGTYSMRLLSERYLAGRVSFTTSVEHGTTFRVRFPLLHPQAEQK